MPMFPVPPPMKPSTAPRMHTVADLLQAYTSEALPQKADDTQRHYRHVYALFGAQHGTLPLTELTPELLRAYRVELSQRCRPATVRHYLAALGSALTAAVDDYAWLAVNPMAKVRRPPKPAGRLRFLTDAERQALLAACRQSQNPLLYTVVLLALTTGGRRNEVGRLRWSEVDFERELVLFVVTKNRRPRSVPLVGPALNVLRQQHAQHTSPWVFPNETGARPQNFERAWRTARQRAGLVDFRFHDLRHSAASALARAGAALHTIAEILGHTDIQQTMRYVHLVESHTRNVIERMSQHCFGEGAPDVER